MATAFLGYVLPWGQMSFWAATVITKFLSSIPYVGKTLVVWIWGGYSVRGVTLTRFFALHYVIPFVLIVFVLLHKLFLHETGSKTPISKLPKGDKLKFHPYYSWKDVFGFILFFLIFKFIVLLFMKLFFDSENFIEANSLVTPIHIQPEWYFLASYAILRSIPKKLGGVLGLLLSVRIFFFLPLIKNKFSIYKKNKFFFSFFFVIWIFNFFLLRWIGSKPVEIPFSTLGVVSSIFYFLFFTIYLLPIPLNKKFSN